MEMYSPVRGRIINDEEVLQQGVRTYRMAREDLEPILQRQFGRKLEPVREQLPRKRSEGTVVYLNDDIRKRHR